MNDFERFCIKQGDIPALIKHAVLKLKLENTISEMNKMFDEIVIGGV